MVDLKVIDSDLSTPPLGYRTGGVRLKLSAGAHVRREMSPSPYHPRAGDGLREGYHENRRCPRDTYPVLYVTNYTSMRKEMVDLRVLPAETQVEGGTSQRKRRPMFPGITEDNLSGCSNVVGVFLALAMCLLADFTRYECRLLPGRNPVMLTTTSFGRSQKIRTCRGVTYPES